jgi:DnaJ-class molecular chaperone
MVYNIDIMYFCQKIFRILDNTYYIKHTIRFLGTLSMTKILTDCPECGGTGKVPVSRGQSFDDMVSDIYYGKKMKTCPRCGGEKFIIKDSEIIDLRRISR